MDHLGEQHVLDLIGGALVEPLASDAHDHLDACDECRAVVANALRIEGSDPDQPPRGSEVDDTELGDTSTLADRPAARRSAKAFPATEIAEYRLLEQIGRGGMGTVYRALDTLLDREVAIKLIARTSSEVARQRFLVEARAVARIRHPNVVVVHRVGVEAERPYIVYDLVRGRTVAELRSPMPWFKVLELAVGIARGLAATHACGVLHRDLKPANVMLDDRDDIVLVDFGLAKLDGEPAVRAEHEAIDTAAPGITQAGTAMGTPRYMAPESWAGAPPTPQTDFYSLGLILHELLSGKLPFADAPASDLARRVCSEDPPSIASVAPWVPALVCELVDRCIARDPAQRPAAAGALVDELEAIQRGRAFEGFERDRVRRLPPGNPYPGERAFGFEHQGVFFGRRAELRCVIDHLRSRPLVVVAGEPGAGKTSLCMAGVLPLVLRGALAGARKWVPVPMVAGPDPIGAFAEAISAHVERDPGELPRQLREDPEPILEEFRAGHRGGCTAHVLYVDELDALVTRASPEDARLFATILGRLAEPAPALRVLASLRTSQMMAVAQLPGLTAAIGPALFLLLEPRDEAELHDIVVEPARLTGRSVTDDLARSLVEDAARGKLPLRDLGQRLASLWEQLPSA